MIRNNFFYYFLSNVFVLKVHGHKNNELNESRYWFFFLLRYYKYLTLKTYNQIFKIKIFHTIFHPLLIQTYIFVLILF
jgi:hypothetical protein